MRADLPACTEGANAFRAKNYEQAQTLLWECVLARPMDLDGAHKLTLTYRELKNYDAGIRRVTDALTSSPRSVDLLYVAGFLQFRQRNHQESIRLLGQAYRVNPQDWRVRQLFALNYVVLGIRDGAVAEFRTAVSLNPSNAELHYQLARFYHSDGLIQESVDESGKALAIFPDYPEVYENLGLCYEALGEDQLARQNFTRAIELLDKFEQKDEWPFLNYGEFLLKRGDAQASTKLFQRALDMNPRSGKGNYFMGRAMRTLGRNDEARFYLERSLKSDPADPAPYFELGTLLNRLGERDAARPLFERFQALRKSQPVTTGAMGR